MKIKLGKYRHFKGNEYEVIGVGKHSETLEEMVIYKSLYISKEFNEKVIWIRPVKSFNEHVEIAGKQVPRFQFLGE